MLTNQKKIFFLLAVTLLSAACGDSSKKIAQSSQVVAKINDKEITTSFVERRMSRLSPIAHKALKTKEGQQEFIKSLTSRELILQAAQKEELHKTPAFHSKVTDFKDDLLTQLYIQKKLSQKNFLPSEQEVQEFYNSKQENFKEQPEIRISHIFLPSKVEAEEVLKQITSGADFAKLAAEKSANRATAQRGGDMGFVRKWQLPPKIADEIFSMEPGQITEILPSEFGFTIIKVTDKRMGKEVPLKAVEKLIQANLAKQKQRDALEELVESLEKNATITLNESVLASLNFSLGGDVQKESSPDNTNNK